jgi:hypothetical protein
MMAPLYRHLNTHQVDVEDGSLNIFETGEGH